eukprot:TRINITY_DN7371_c0_g3_i1.p1 TRINITY_DN7371_c0_g3~~TRINITY_DN7371_c0_g3_i1.p1  ORF type:complete len:301 (-),score=45.15 TRINITY_DN7371_c0_g3_i1:153-1055(-)
MEVKDSLSGLCGAICCTYIGSPFDVAKARLQSQALAPSGPRYSGLVHCILQTARLEGMRGLWKGATPALTSAVVENAVGMTVQRATHRMLARRSGDINARFSMGTECLIGGLAGIFTSLAMCPFEVMKVRLQVARGTSAATGDVVAAGRGGSVLACAKDIFNTEGVRGFYRGLVSLWARDIPFNAIFFGSYESTCTLMMRAGNLRSKDELSNGQVLLAGGVAGALGWSVVLPFDVVKTRLQTGCTHGSCLQVMRSIVMNEGIAALYLGWGAAVARAFPANAGLFLGVELSNRWLDKLLNS